MGKWCLLASLFIFDWIIIKVAVIQDRRKSSVKFDFGQNQTTHFGVTCPWVTKFHTFELEYLWSQLANLDQILCVASLGWGKGCKRCWGRLTLAHWTQVSDRCPLGYLLGYFEWFSCFFLYKKFSTKKKKKSLHTHPKKYWDVSGNKTFIFFWPDWTTTGPTQMLLNWSFQLVWRTS